MVGLPKSQLFIVPGATHVSMLEKSVVIGSQIIGFFDAK
jgi:pimeloyl-ACP methyl ester carboxylesterase